MLGDSLFPWGIGGFKGGADGLTSGLLLTRHGEAPVKLPSMLATIPVRKGDKITAIGGIGGGYGNPHERSAEQVLENVLDGYFDIESAERDYDVVITVDCQIDAEATQKLRAAR